ncbi:MAG: hypothetical protein IJ930_00425 [Lachnospiraceae bacterium]|nr:hypothetical protein [Lachnospiraceae bacterium]
MENSQNGPEYYSQYLDDGYRLAGTAFILGLISLGSMFIFPVFMTCICGPLSIILAILSKGENRKMISRAKLGVVFSVISLVLTALIIAGSVLLALRMMSDPVYRNELDQLVQRYYGYPLEELLPPGVFE